MLPAIEVTTPRGTASLSSTGPCSMCTSTKPRRLRVGKAAAGIAAGSNPAATHGLPHRDSVGIDTVEHGRVESTRQGATAQKCRLEANAFLFGKGDDCHCVRQSHASTPQIARRRLSDRRMPRRPSNFPASTTVS